MKLTHLYGVFGKGSEQALLPVDYNAVYAIATIPYAPYGILIVLRRFVSHEGQVQRPAGSIVKGQENAEAATPVGGVKMDKTPAAQGWLHPVTTNIMESALHGRHAHAKTQRKLPDRLLLFLVNPPQFIIIQRKSRAKLIAAVLAQIQLDASALSVLDGVQRLAHRAFLLVHTNSLISF